VSGGRGAVARTGDGAGALAAPEAGDDDLAGPIGARTRQPEVVAVAVLCALATVVFGIYPSPLLDVARDAGAALVNLV
jgi:NADH-quinone oxidoreductase subunit N